LRLPARPAGAGRPPLRNIPAGAQATARMPTQGELAEENTRRHRRRRSAALRTLRYVRTPLVPAAASLFSYAMAPWRGIRVYYAGFRKDVLRGKEQTSGAMYASRPMFTWRLGRKGHIARFHGTEGIRRNDCMSKAMIRIVPQLMPQSAPLCQLSSPRDRRPTQRDAWWRARESLTILAQWIGIQQRRNRVGVLSTALSLFSGNRWHVHTSDVRRWFEWCQN